jgi:hypothetical protein
MSSIAMTISMERALRAACVEMGDAMLSNIADHYKMDMSDLRRVSGISDLVVTKAVKKTAKKSVRKAAPKKAVPGLPLPFVGNVDETSCYGIRLNHGLHTQCSNNRVEGLDYCKTCVKHAEKNASGKPSYGDIRDRLECGLLDYVDPKGKQTLPYINVVEKLALDMDAVKEEASKFGVEIPEEHMVKRDTRRGRPKKDATSVSDTDSETSKPKKRGRPKKEKEVESVVADDLLSALKNAQADAKKVTTVKEETSNSDSGSVSSKTSKKSGGRPRLTDEEKAAKLAKKEAEKQRKAEEKAAKLAEKEAEKQRKAEEKAAKLAEKEAEKQRKAEEKAAKLAEKEAEKQRKAEEKAVKLAEKEVEKTTETSHTSTPDEAVAEAVDEVVAEEADEAVVEAVKEENAVKVKKFTINGVTYLRTADDVLYDIETQEPVGIYDPNTGEIEEVDAVSDDEEEEDEDDE